MRRGRYIKRFWLLLLAVAVAGIVIVPLVIAAGPGTPPEPPQDGVSANPNEPTRTPTPRPEEFGTPPARLQPAVKPIEAPTIDLAPGVPEREKPHAVVQRADGTLVVIAMPPGMHKEDLVPMLEAGDQVVTIYPSLAMMESGIPGPPPHETHSEK